MTDAHTKEIYPAKLNACPGRCIEDFDCLHPANSAQPHHKDAIGSPCHHTPQPEAEFVAMTELELQNSIIELADFTEKVGSDKGYRVLRQALRSALHYLCLAEKRGKALEPFAKAASALADVAYRKESIPFLVLEFVQRGSIKEREAQGANPTLGDLRRAKAALDGEPGT